MHFIPSSRQLGVPKLKDVSEIFLCGENALAYFKAEAGLKVNTECPHCRSIMRLWGIIKRSSTRSCRFSKSILSGTALHDLRKGVTTFLNVVYLWLLDTPMRLMQALTGVTDRTLISYVGRIKRFVTMDLNIDEIRIGREGVMVEIDESLFGKTKHHRGRPVKGVWVFGSVERTEEKNRVAIVVEKRSAKRLLPIINRHVRPGSITYSDMWRAYLSVSEIRLEHCSVSHKKHFKGPEAGLHTNTIESVWNGFKSKIISQKRVKKEVQVCINEILWKRMHRASL